ncbi:hypothetical protein MAR_021711 [Mya arenaria]|uniref:DDE Tnp4 domain-containing protein n=1 Tax=Mya arenaria TaxID=6604 RepID=A0ABY7EC24_MYAAR|nr:hypothetical protein MAR_021711 [Mya arenaria]
MKPYSTRNLTHEERIFNYRLSRARRVVESVFGILANRFQVLLTTMQHHHETVRTIVEACCILHNLMRTCFPVLQNRLVDRAQPDGNLQPGAWREGRNLEDTIVVQGPNTASRDGKRQRNLLKHWCNFPTGSVDWQERMGSLQARLWWRHGVVWWWWRRERVRGCLGPRDYRLSFNEREGALVLFLFLDVVGRLHQQQHGPPQFKKQGIGYQFHHREKVCKDGSIKEGY